MQEYWIGYSIRRPGTPHCEAPIEVKVSFIAEPDFVWLDGVILNPFNHEIRKLKSLGCIAQCHWLMQMKF